MDQIQNAVAEIFAIEDSGIQIKLRDRNKKSLGSFFKLKKDGLPTVAFQQFQDMGLKSGSLVSIGFKEVPYKDTMLKNIIGFRETNEQAQSYQAPPSMVRKEYLNGTYDERSKPEAPKGQDAFGKRLAVHGLINGLLAGGIKMEEINIAGVMAFEDQINAALKGEVDPSDIPF